MMLMKLMVTTRNVIKITTVSKSQRAKLNNITTEHATPVPEKQNTDKLLCYEGILPKPCS